MKVSLAAAFGIRTRWSLRMVGAIANGTPPNFLKRAPNSKVHIREIRLHNMYMDPSRRFPIFLSQSVPRIRLVSERSLAQGRRYGKPGGSKAPQNQSSRDHAAD